jgi:pyroglutamyl-peptidase
MAASKASGSGPTRDRSFGAFPPDDVDRRLVLLTGFGSFPGVPHNASADLVAELAKGCRLRLPDIRFRAEVLPVDWHEAPRQLQTLLRLHEPRCIIHFGVSSRASGFVVERYAYNAVGSAPDSRGQLANDARLVPGDRPRRAATLPTHSMVRRLQEAGYPAELSDDPGRYLCNAVLFHSLRHAARVSPRIRSGFVHIPATLGTSAEGAPSAIAWSDAVHGGLALIEACLAPLRRSNAILS